MARSHTKKGSGRTHGQCLLIADPTNGKHLGVRKPVGLRIAAYGGSWAGKPYLSYREHDLATRLTFAGPGQMHRLEAETYVTSLRY